jgi:hypothetical protein
MKWIKISDKMPNSGDCVLLYSKAGGVSEGAYIGLKKHFEQWRWDCVLQNVTHWMPLPEPPEEKENGNR